MTHSSHRFTTLSADDVALCRAHSEAIDDARESRALQRWIDAVAPLVTPVMSVRAFEVGNHMPADLPMPPSYWDDLEHWLKTLAPAKPAEPKPATHVPVAVSAPAWRTGPEIPRNELVGLWHVRLPDGSSAGPARRAVSLKFDQSEYRPAAPGTKAGDPYDESKYTTPAHQPAQKASTHSVCIKAHKSRGFNRDIGTVLPMLPHHRSRPECWLPCDESGWVTHVPTADSVCPVPEGLDFAAMWCDGYVSGLGSRYFREHVNTWRSNHIHGGMRAWRPIAQS